MANRILTRRGTAAEWTAANPTLAAGERGYETDTKKTKIGDSTTAWNSLPYEGDANLAVHVANASGAGRAALNAAIAQQGYASYAPFYAAERTSKLSAIPSSGIMQALTTTKSKVSAVRGGTGTLRVLCVGDSTTAGNDATKTTGWPAAAWPAQAAKTLTDDGIKAEAGMGIAPATSNLTVDGRWTVGSGWSWLQSADIGWGSGVCLRTSNAAAATGTLQFNPGLTYEKVDVYYTVSSNASFQAVLDVIVGGTTLGQINNAGAGGIGKATFTPAAATSSPVVIDPVSGAAIYILGIECYTAAGTVRLANVGVAGSHSQNWENDNGGYAPLDCIRAYAPDLTIINLGINDSGWTPARATVGLTNSLTTIGDAADASGDVILCTFVPSADNSDKDETAQAGYWPAIRSLAATKGWGLLDIQVRYGSYSAANARGWMSDLVHPGETGYRNMGYAAADLIEAVFRGVLL